MPWLGAAHTAQLAPQLVTLSAVQAPPQKRNPLLHWISHFEPLQVATLLASVGLALAQPPQWSGSLVTSTHASLQAVFPPKQELAQAPSEQTRPLAAERAARCALRPTTALLSA